MHLFDTDILSKVVRRPAPQHLIERLYALPSPERFTSSITMGELYYGAFRLQRFGTGLLERIRLLPIEDGQVLPFDARTAQLFGGLKADLERRGTPLAEADLRIAAIALAHGLTMVTANVRHFERVPGLLVENWLEP